MIDEDIRYQRIYTTLDVEVQKQSESEGVGGCLPQISHDSLFYLFCEHKTRATGAATEAGWKLCKCHIVKVRGSHTEEKKAVRMQ
jgi:hypothetical protein